MGLFIEKPTPFLPEFLNRIMRLDYPKKRIDLLVHNTVSILSAEYIYLVLIQWNPDFSNLQGKQKLVRKIREFEKLGVKLQCLTEEGKQLLV